MSTSIIDLLSRVSIANLSIVVNIDRDARVTFLVYSEKTGWTVYAGQTLQFADSPSALASHVTIQYPTDARLGTISLTCTPGPYYAGSSSPGVAEYDLGPHEFSDETLQYTLAITVGSRVSTQVFNATNSDEDEPGDIIIIAGPPDPTGTPPPPPGRERPEDLVAQIQELDMMLVHLVAKMFAGRRDPLAEKVRFFTDLRRASTAVLAAQMPTQAFDVSEAIRGESAEQLGRRGPRQSD